MVPTTTILCRSFSEEAKACSCGTWKENVILISCLAILLEPRTLPS